MLRIIGDVHGKYQQYLTLIKDAEYSVQLGDFGFDYQALQKVDATRHKILPGNHDNYDIVFDDPHVISCGLQSLGPYQFFTVRGAFSIDRFRRTPYVNWWSQEQVLVSNHPAIMQAYQTAKPDLVITHTCPSSIAGRIGDPQILRKYGLDPVQFRTDTQTLLEQLASLHLPKRWIFGHFHRNWTCQIFDCQFQCLNELAYIDIV